MGSLQQFKVTKCNKHLNKAEEYNRQNVVSIETNVKQAGVKKKSHNKCEFFICQLPTEVIWFSWIRLYDVERPQTIKEPIINITADAPRCIGSDVN